MSKQEKHSEASAAIDAFLSDYDFDDIARTLENKYQPWYAHALSGLALLAAGQKIVYAESNFGAPVDDVRLTVFTTDRLIVASIDPASDSVPVLQAVARTSLAKLQLSASERIDAKDNRAYAWPGSVVLKLTYPQLDRAVELILANRPARAVKPEAVVDLVEALSADLTFAV